MSKDYSNQNTLALGHLTHEDVAAQLLNLTRSSENFMSVVRAGHDRIHHLTQINVGEYAPFASAPVPVSIGAYEQISEEEQQRRKDAYERRVLQEKIDALTLERDAAVSNQKTAETAVTNIGQQLQDANTRIETIHAELTDAKTSQTALQSELDSTKLEVTTTYMRVSAAESKVAELQATLDDIRTNYEIEGEEDATIGDPNNTAENEAVGYYKPSRDELRVIAVKNGFHTRTQPGGVDDLNDYVYDTLYESIKLSHDRTAEIQTQ